MKKRDRLFMFRVSRFIRGSDIRTQLIPRFVNDNIFRSAVGVEQEPVAPVAAGEIVNDAVVLHGRADDVGAEEEATIQTGAKAGASAGATEIGNAIGVASTGVPLVQDRVHSCRVAIVAGGAGADDSVVG